MRQNAAKAEAFSAVKWIKPVFIGTAIGLVAMTVVLMLFAFLLTLMDIPQGLIVPLALAAVGVGAFVGGYVSSQITGKKGMLGGFLTGLLFYCILTLVALAATGFKLDSEQFLRLAVVLVTGCGGGVVGINRQRTRRV